MGSQRYHEQVAARLIEALRAGTAPWQRPWEPGSVGMLPTNPVTGKRYRGINAVWLLAQNRPDPRWMTYRQAETVGAQVRRGEKSSSIQYWQFRIDRGKVDEAGAPVLDASGKQLRETVELERPRVFFANVFNASQIDGLEPLEVRQREWDPIERAERILSESGAKIEHAASDRALYRPATDTIHLPERAQFRSADRYYATALHELGHWSGHNSRLRRDLGHPFGSAAYAREELRAEIASMILGEELGIGHDPGQHAAYVQSWIQLLEDDALEIFRAAADAERIGQYVMGLEVRQVQRESQAVVQATDPNAVHPSSAEEAGVRVYLEVPYERKEEVKALGARWDRSARQWYVPAGVDSAPLAQWVRSDQARPERQYLAVPYGERREAKALGALWDRAERAWYVGPDADAEGLRRWWPGEGTRSGPEALGPREEFAQVLQGLGFALSGEHPILDGQAKRVALRDDRAGERSGFYVGYLDGHPAGYAKNHRTGEEIRWKAKGYAAPALSAAQREALRTEARAKLAARDAAQERLHEECAQRLQGDLERLEFAVSSAPYLERKGVAPTPGLRVDSEGTLHIPAYDAEGKHWTTQFIREDGSKRFAKGAKKEGCFHPLHGWDALASASVLVIAEGWATAASVSEALGETSVAAFDAGNLLPVAVALRERFPDKPIVIAGDDDRGGRTNPGRQQAERAAEAVGGVAVIPTFARSESELTDWNDLAVRSSLGGEAVQRQLAVGLQKATREADDQKRQERQLRVEPRKAHVR